VALAAAVVVLALVLAVRDARPTRSQERQAEQTWAALLRPLVEASNRSGYQVADLRYRAGALGRVGVERHLEQLVGSTSAVAASAASLMYPAPAARARHRLLEALSARAQAARLLDAGLRPVLAGTGGAQVLADLERAGRLMVGADGNYRGFLAALSAPVRRAVGLPASRWVSHPADWSPDSLASYVSDLASTPSLAVIHRVVLATVEFDPVPVGFGTVTTLPPTTTLRLSPVVANAGNVAERDLAVTATLTPQSGGGAQTVSSRVGLAFGQHLVVALPPLAVSPGSTYLLAVTAGPAPGQATTTDNQQLFTVKVSS
jgi:hypothetical protein